MQCKALLHAHPDLTQVATANKFTTECEDLFLSRRLHPTLTQKLTVLQERLPQELEKALVGECLERPRA